MCLVVNIKKISPDWQDDPDYVYIGRAGKGLKGYFGNPIVVGKQCPVCRSWHNSGGSTLPCYRKWLITKVYNDPDFRQKLLELKDKTLVCFCKPAPCHGDIIKEYLEITPRQLKEVTP